MKAVIKLGVPLAVVIPLRSTGKTPPGAAGAKKKDLKFHPIRTTRGSAQTETDTGPPESGSNIH